uniref:Uncharacterized protein n=1 Tax=Anguilla anguilla TaxID=7936 RepID=A0A0E9RYY4_ANGAN
MTATVPVFSKEKATEGKDASFSKIRICS